MIFENFFLLIFELLISQTCSPETPKIEVRLLSSSPNKDNRFNIEIENISNHLITLESASIALKNNANGKLFLYLINLTKEQLILPPFFPKTMLVTVIEEEYTHSIIKYFKFKLLGERKITIKVKPINMFNNND